MKANRPDSRGAKRAAAGILGSVMFILGLIMMSDDVDSFYPEALAITVIGVTGAVIFAYEAIKRSTT